MISMFKLGLTDCRFSFRGDMNVSACTYDSVCMLHSSIPCRISIPACMNLSRMRGGLAPLSGPSSLLSRGKYYCCCRCIIYHADRLIDRETGGDAFGKYSQPSFVCRFKKKKYWRDGWIHSSSLYGRTTPLAALFPAARRCHKSSSEEVGLCWWCAA